MENRLADFWKPALSRAFADNAPGHSSNGTGQRKGTRTPRAELVSRAKALRQQGYSYGEIAKVLGIGKTTAHGYVQEKDSTA